MNHTDKQTHKTAAKDDEDKETASKRADAGAAPEQTGSEPEPDDVSEDVKRHDPPVPGQPKRIRVGRRTS